MESPYHFHLTTKANTGPQGYTANWPFSYHPKAPRTFYGEIFYELISERPFLVPLPTSVVNAAGASSLQGETRVFETTWASNNGYAGNLFTIQAKTDIILEAFDLNSGSTEGIGVKIYTKFGGFDRSDIDPASNWIEICSTRVQGRGESLPTHVPAADVKSIAIKGNEKQSFYVTFQGPFMRYTSALLDPNYLSNEHLGM